MEPQALLRVRLSCVMRSLWALSFCVTEATAAAAGSSVVGKIPNGTDVTVVSAVQGWAYIDYNGLKGWVSADYLIEVVEATTVQTAQIQTTTQKSV